MTERREQTAAETVLTRIGQTVLLHHAGDREEARRRLLGLWAEIGADGDPLHRCTLAHYLADTQDDPVDELAWDLRALTAAGELAQDRPATGDHARAARALYPSLHLNLAADYLGLGHREAARSHVRRARLASEHLADSAPGRPGHDCEYGVRVAIGRLEERLAEGNPGEEGPGKEGPGKGPGPSPGAGSPGP